MEKDLSIRSDDQTRRFFLYYSLLGSFITLMAGITYSILRYLYPSKRKEFKLQKDILTVPLNNLEPGSSQILRFRGKPIIIVHTGNNEVFALSAVCTHLGCIVKWHSDKKQLICPCHAAKFDLFGNVLAGPAPKPLPSYSAKIKENKIIVE